MRCYGVGVLRKRRTREHVIADLSVNHIERFILRCGHAADRVLFDYGYDLIVRTFDANGEIEPDFFLIQLKASDTPDYVASGRFITLPLDPRDAEAWEAERVPVVLVAYDAARDAAYWVHFQGAIARVGRATIRIPTTQPVNEAAVEAMRRLKNEGRSARG
jgi:hypothetical protein